ncbi:unnamed protein product [Linum tenue]|uniref:Uncharacterized protein n=1 Tax=Linum tenue TaxID=586396 RepID=A0AAV0KY86_9ROSI|nr:unnamed protein product [Linum tenue]
MGSGSFSCLGSTVESLRGMLLAERQASRVANEEAEQLADKLRELEKKLKEETKQKWKAEKKLTFLVKKLQSLNNISSSLTPQELYCSPSGSSSSSILNTSSSSHKDPEEGESKVPKIRIPDRH